MSSENRKTILLVEDEAIIAIAQKKTLEKYGYKVITANNGERAINVFRENDDIDLILMDIDLGKSIDGTETAKRILAEHNLPVVFLSSHTEPEIVEKTEKITSYGYVVKNSGITVLDASIKMAFKLFEANRQIVESEIKQKAMISNISDVIAIIDYNSIIKYKSPNIRNWFGWEPDDLIGTDCWSTVHPDDVERIQKVFFNLLDNNYYSKTVEYRYKCKDGSYKLIELTASNLLNDPVVSGILLNYHDITERKKTEEILRFHSIILEHLTEGVQLTRTADLSIVYVNSTFEKMFGYDPEELIGKSVNILNAPGENSPEDTVLEILSEIKTGGRWHGVIRNIRKDGTFLWCSATVSMMNHPFYGEVYVTVQEDITERKLVLDKLQESEEKYRHLHETIMDAIAFVDLNGIIKEFNSLFKEMLGYTTEELKSLTYADITPEEWHAFELKIVSEQVMVRGFSDVYEKEYRRKDGTIMPVELRTFLIKDNSGQPSGMWAIIRDITDRKQTESILRESEQRYRSLFTSITEGFALHEIIFDDNGKPCDYCFLNVNPAFEQLTGLKGHDIIGKKQSQVLPDEDPYWLETYSKVALTGESIHIEHYSPVIKKYFHVFAYCPEPGKFAVIFSDITERELMYKALLKSEERYKKTQRMGHVGSWEYNLQTENFWGSDEAKRIYGFDPEKSGFTTDEVENCIPERKRVHQALIDLIEHGKDYNLEFEIHPRNGSEPRIIWSVAELLRDEKGKPILVTGLIQDITDRKHAEELIRIKNEELESLNEELNAAIEEMEAVNEELIRTNGELAESEEKLKNTMNILNSREGHLRTLLQTIPDLVWLKDEDGVYLSCNKMFERFFGAEETDITGKTDYDFLSQEIAEFFRRHDRNAMQAGKPTVNEEWITFADDGHRVYLETIKTPMYDEDGTLIGVLGIGRDITGRKRAEEELEIKNEELNAALEEMEAANEELIAAGKDLQAKEKALIGEKKFTEALLECIPGYLYVYDDQGNLIRWNKKHEEMTGYSAEELSQMNMSQWFEGEDAVRVAAAVDEVFRTGYGEVEANLIIKGGRKLLIHSNGVRLIIDGKNYFTGVGTDVTERRRLEEELIQSKLTLEAMLQTMVDGMVTADLSGRITYSNKAAGKILSIGKDVLGKDYKSREWRQLDENGDPYPLEQLPLAVAMREQREVLNVEHQIEASDGERKWLSVNAAPLFDEAGKLSGGVASFRDITENKRLVEELKKNERRFEQLIKNSSDTIVILDADGIQLYVSDVVERILGYKPEEVTNIPVIQEMIHPEDIEKTHAAFLEIINKGHGSAEYRHRHKKGGWVYLEAWGSNQLDNPDIRGVVLNVRDITRRKRAEEEIQLDEARLESLLKINQHPAESIQDLLDFALNEAIVLTGSKIGYIYFYDENKKEFVLNTWSKEVMQQCAVVEKQTIYHLEKTGLWGEAVRQRCPIMVNDFNAPNPLRKGLPEGHNPLKKFLTIPVVSNEHIVAVVGVANKEIDYNDSDIRQLNLMMDAVWKIVQRKKAEENVQKLLREKELLLQEVHHRIKNNMNTIKSLLNLQADAQENPEIANVLFDAENRVISMMVLYDRLYRSDDYRIISIKDYIPALAHEIISNFPSGKKVKIIKKLDDFVLDVKILQPLGIIINELLTNIMKYAFTDREDGIITISSDIKGSHVSIIIHDNGVGIPESIEIENSTGFGMQLVGMLTEQIGGKIRIERGEGSTFILEFDA